MTQTQIIRNEIINGSTRGSTSELKIIGKLKLLATYRYAIGAAMLLLLAQCSYGFKAEDPIKDPEKAIGIEVKPAINRPVSAEQHGVARLAEKSGVNVEWHPRLGTPLSVRGSNLGQRRDYSGGKGLMLRGGANYEQDAIAVLDNLSRFYRIRDVEKEFAVKKVERDSLGFHHVRLAQVYQGLRVFGGDLIVHFDKIGVAYQVNGEYVADIEVGVAPKIDANSALEIAQTDLAKLGKPQGTPKEAPTLVIFALNSDPRLAWELTRLYDDAKAGAGRWRYWVDALGGEVLLRYNDIKKINPPTANGTNAVITGNILTGEGGQLVTVTGWYENTGYYYLYNTNRRWYVYNVATSGWPDYGTYAYRTTSNWATSDRAEMSTARNFDLVQRYYSEVHGRYSFNNAGIYARANIHEGVNYVNAYWDGTGFHFGDGDGVEANSLAILDVCGHEFTHAVTEYTADLTYANESGALNESFSDVMGAAIEFYA